MSDELLCPICGKDRLHFIGELADCSHSTIEVIEYAIILRKQLDEWEEKEAACCPEDFGFDEVIKSLRKQLDEIIHDKESAEDARDVYKTNALRVRDERDTLRKQLIELQADKVELISQRDNWIGSSDALSARINKIQSCSNPDDYMKVDDIIEALKAERDALQAKLDVAVEALKSIRVDIISGNSALFTADTMFITDGRFYLNRGLRKCETYLAEIEKVGKDE